MERKSSKPMVMYLMLLVVIGFLILFMSSGKQLQKPAGNADDFPVYLAQLNTDLQEDDWKEARTTLKRLESSWEAVIPRIRYSVDRNQIGKLNVSLAEIRKAVELKDKTAALQELAELKKYWNELGTQT